MGTGLRVGYACVNTQLPSSSRTVRLANATDERLRELIATNLDALDTILRWNVAHEIAVFRLTSNLIPFASHAVNRLAWWDEFAPRLRVLGRLMKRHGMSISTHPGQYTVLSSERAPVVDAALAELEYHARLLDAFGLGPSHKVVLHVGGASRETASTSERFERAFERLSAGAAKRLVLENDERWPLADVLPIAARVGVPVVFDAFHHSLAPSFDGAGIRELVVRAGSTWTPRDGRQEVHFSSQQAGRRPGAHADTIDLDEFERFVEDVGDLPVDCVLEVKDKERSALRAQAVLRARVYSRSS